MQNNEDYSVKYIINSWQKYESSKRPSFKERITYLWKKSCLGKAFVILFFDLFSYLILSTLSLFLIIISLFFNKIFIFAEDVFNFFKFFIPFVTAFNVVFIILIYRDSKKGAESILTAHPDSTSNVDFKNFINNQYDALLLHNLTKDYISVLEKNRDRLFQPYKNLFYSSIIGNLMALIGFIPGTEQNLPAIVSLFILILILPYIFEYLIDVLSFKANYVKNFDQLLVSLILSNEDGNTIDTTHKRFADRNYNFKPNPATYPYHKPRAMRQKTHRQRSLYQDGQS